MTRSMLCAMVCAIALIGGQAMADDVATASCCDTCCGDVCSACCADPCVGNGSLYFLVDFTFMKYHQAGGVRDSAGAMGEFDFEFNPRYVLGYERSDGLGVRVGYWDYEETAETRPIGVPVTWYGIDAYAFDMEVYQRVELGSCTTLEAFGGLRWIEWEVTDSYGLFTSADGYGGKVGFEAARKIGCYDKVFARATWSIVPVDAQLVNLGAFQPGAGIPAGGWIEDSETTITEVAVGVAGARPINCAALIYGAGAEWSQWTDVSPTGDAANDLQLADGGWAGFFFRVGVQY